MANMKITSRYGVHYIHKKVASNFVGMINLLEKLQFKFNIPVADLYGIIAPAMIAPAISEN